MYYIKVNKDNNRVLFVATYYDYIPQGVIAVADYPHYHPIQEYLYKDGEFIYSPDKLKQK
jgi:hypothetical protein